MSVNSPNPAGFKISAPRTLVLRPWSFPSWPAVLLAFGVISIPCAKAQLVFDAGFVSLQPNLSGQAIPFYIENQGQTDVQVGGLDLIIQIGDGTQSNIRIQAAGGSVPRPVDLITSTIFKDNNLGNFADSANKPQQQFWSTSYNGDEPIPVLQPGMNLIATVTFDTTGVQSGSWSLLFKNTGIGSTVVNDPNNPPGAVFVDINNGTVAIVPEVNASLAVAGALLLLCVSKFFRAPGRVFATRSCF